jgi:hypothetical protein
MRRRLFLRTVLGAAGAVMLPVRLPASDRVIRSVQVPVAEPVSLIPAFVASPEFQERLATETVDRLLGQMAWGLLGGREPAELRARVQWDGWRAAAEALCGERAFQEHATLEEAALLPLLAGMVEAPDEHRRAVYELQARAAKVQRLYRGFYARPPSQWELGTTLLGLGGLWPPPWWEAVAARWWHRWVAWASGQTVGGTIAASHVTTLRTQINALRGRYGLAPFAFADPTCCVPQESVIRHVHFQQLREALAEVYAKTALTPLYPSGPIAPGAPIRASDVVETQQARALIAQLPLAIAPPPMVSQVRAGFWNGGGFYPWVRTVPNALANDHLLRTNPRFYTALQELGDEVWRHTFADAVKIWAAMMALAVSAELFEIGSITAVEGVRAIAAGLRAGTITVQVATVAGGLMFTFVGVGLVAFALVAIYFVVRAMFTLPAHYPAGDQVDVNAVRQLPWGSYENSWDSLDILY